MATYTAVKTTGIYCRLGCGARPLQENTVGFDLAASAEVAGFRACLRCRPYRDSVPTYSTGPDVVCRAVGMILDGVLDDQTEVYLANRVGVSARHLRRLFQSHLGATPNELARSTRAHFARRMLDDTDLSITEIAFAAGFGSVRQLNRVSHRIFKASPSELRAARRKGDRLVADGGLLLRLPFKGPLAWDEMIRFFGPRAIPGVEHVAEDVYRRTVLINDDPGVIEIMAGDESHLLLKLHLPHWEELIHIARRAGEIFGLNRATDEALSHLANDPTIGPLISDVPGVRVPGAWDPFEIAVRAVVGQAITVGQATAIAGRLVEQFGQPVPGLTEMGLTHLFPSPETLGSADLSALGIPQTRQIAIQELARAVASEDLRLEIGAHLETLIGRLRWIHGVGPWTAHYIALRLGEADALPVSDVGLQKAYECLTDNPSISLDRASQRWRPWRALAATHLWLHNSRVSARQP